MKTRILIVKMSSLGDIFQALPVVSYLYQKFDHPEIDWIAEHSFCEFLTYHPHIHEVLPANTKKWRKNPFDKEAREFSSSLRKKSYDLVIDLQGNTKSGVFTLLAKGREKIGFSRESAAEWPNILSTKSRYNVRSTMHIGEKYLDLVQQHFHDKRPFVPIFPALHIPECEKNKINQILSHSHLQQSPIFMICPGSRWENKMLSVVQWESFLEKVVEKFSPSFLFVWGDDRALKVSEALSKKFSTRSLLQSRLPIPAWHRLISRVDLLLTVDSSALHLNALTCTPSFSIFGPSSPMTYNPKGTKHGFFQGVCPYKKNWDGRCPILRTCHTGACMKDVSPEKLAQSFFAFVKGLGN